MKSFIKTAILISTYYLSIYNPVYAFPLATSPQSVQTPCSHLAKVGSLRIEGYECMSCWTNAWHLTKDLARHPNARPRRLLGTTARPRRRLNLPLPIKGDAHLFSKTRPRRCPLVEKVTHTFFGFPHNTSGTCLSSLSCIIPRPLLAH